MPKHCDVNGCEVVQSTLDLIKFLNGELDKIEAYRVERWSPFHRGYQRGRAVALAKCIDFLHDTLASAVPGSFREGGRYRP